jgi:methionine aminopeptidase
LNVGLCTCLVVFLINVLCGVIEAMGLVLAGCQPGARIFDLCKSGDTCIIQLVNKVYTKQSMERGIAFPTTISLNQIVCGFTPLQQQHSGYNTHDSIIKVGDLVKV